MTGRTHQVTQHKSALPGIEAMTLVTDRAFPVTPTTTSASASWLAAPNGPGAASAPWSPAPAISSP